jgi:acetyltransferase-like isoleucine patch superfamily enzyme
MIYNPEFVHLGSNVIIEKDSNILAIKEFLGIPYQPSIIIGSNVYIGRFCKISSVHSIIIEDNVTIGDNVHITDNDHSYENVELGVMQQPLKIGSIIIRKNAWIGRNSVIMPDVIIGQNSVVGANSFINKTVEDRTVVAGNPSRVVKRYNEETKVWDLV